MATETSPPLFVWGEVQISDDLDAVIYAANIESKLTDALFEKLSNGVIERDSALVTRAVDKVFDYFVPTQLDAYHLVLAPVDASWLDSGVRAMYDRRVADKPFDLGSAADTCIRHFREAVSVNQPTHIFTATISLYQLLTALQNKGLSFRLPPGSCVVHSGGLKGKRGAVPLSRLPVYVAETIGVPPSCVVSAYTTSEMPSVLLTPNYRLARRQDGPIPKIVDESHQLPPWVRARVNHKGELAFRDLLGSHEIITRDKGEVISSQFVRLTV